MVETAEQTEGFAVSEWTIQVETPSGLTRDEQALVRFQESFTQNELAFGAATSMDPQAGTLSATFQVEATNEQDAALQGCFAYWRALGAADLRPESLSQVFVTRGRPGEGGEFVEPSVAYRILVERGEVAGP